MKPLHTLNVWRLHPVGIRIEPADPTLRGRANVDALRYCRPYSAANGLGWWVFSGIDFDVRWNSDGTYDHRLSEPYSDADRKIVESLCPEVDVRELDIFCPPSYGRTKLSFGKVENDVVQIWTGCIFQTEPGICLQVRSPVNFDEQRGFHVMEGVLETDWMSYDIWLNLVITERDRWISVRRSDATPLAQLIPLSRQMIESRCLIGRDELVSRADEPARTVVDFWLRYNREKFCGQAREPLSPSDPTVRKDSRTFYRRRVHSLRQSRE